MKCLPLSLLVLALAVAGMSSAKEQGASSSGAIMMAPASSPSVAPSATASTSASASTAGSMPASAVAASPMAAANQSSHESMASAPAAAAQTSSSPAPTMQPGVAAAASSSAPSAGSASAMQASSMHATGNAADGLDWKTGPRDIALLDQAIVKLPRDYAYLEQGDARQLLRKLGNPDPGNITGLFAGPGGNWVLVVRFNKSGYIKANEIPDWKLDELFNALQKNTEDANVLRKKNGLNETELVGWIEKPDYDAKKHRLTWAISSREKGGKLSDFQSVNFNIYLLGREGYFDFSLVTDLAPLAQNKKYASTLVSAVSFRDGKKYGDFKKGKDKAAPYGVAELVTIGGVREQTEQNHDSKFVRFIKIFSLILLIIAALAGIAFGIFYFLRKRRIAKLEAELAAPEAAEAAAPK